VAYADLSDVINSYEGTISESQEPLVTTRLDEAERLIRATYRRSGMDLDAMVTAGRTTAEDVRDVLCGMVIRVLRNANGATTQTAGPFSITVDRATASGTLWLTREDRTRLGLSGRGGASVELVDDCLRHVTRTPGDPHGVDGE